MESPNRRPFFNRDLGFALLFTLIVLALIAGCIWGVDGGFSFGIVIFLLFLSFLAFCAFLSGWEKLKAARSVYDYQNPERARQIAIGRKKILRISIPSAIICILAIAIVSSVVHKNKTEAAIELYKAEVITICEKWEMDSPKIEISLSRFSNDYYLVDVYGAIGGDSAKKKYENIYQMIKELDEIRSSYSKVLFGTDVIVSGTEYHISADGKELRNADYETVYTYVSEEERTREESFLKKLRNELPYEGLEEKYIAYTSLGSPGPRELSHDYYAKVERARSVKYKWYNDKGKIICVATVRAWDFGKDKVVEPYISDVSFYWEYSHYND